MPQVLVGPDRISTEIDAGACAYDVVGDKARQVVVARVNGEIVDLSHPLADGDAVEPILISDPEGLSVLRHSVAHIVAQATQAIFDDVKVVKEAIFNWWTNSEFDVIKDRLGSLRHDVCDAMPKY